MKRKPYITKNNTPNNTKELQILKRRKRQSEFYKINKDRQTAKVLKYRNSKPEITEKIKEYQKLRARERTIENWVILDIFIEGAINE